VVTVAGLYVFVTARATPDVVELKRARRGVLRQHPRAVAGDRGDVSKASMPIEGALVDRYGRVHDDLRVSVTDRCTFAASTACPTWA